MPTGTMDATVLDSGAALSGRFSGRDLLVRGGFEGELVLSGRLQTATGSRLRAHVRAAVVEIEGEFDGEIRAGTLRLAGSARARGVFVADRLDVREGALLEGAVNLASSDVSASELATATVPPAGERSEPIQAPGSESPTPSLESSPSGAPA